MTRQHGACGLALWCALVLAACDEDTTGFGTLQARLQLDASSVVLGERYLGTRSHVLLPLRCLGNAAVRTALHVEGAGATAFVVEPHLVIPADSTAALRVEFVPDRPGPLDAVLHIEHDADTPGPLQLVLHGSGRELPGCDDDNACTDDWFDVQSETCQHRAREGSCDDGSACTEGDRCVAGTCVGQAVRCVDAQGCTLDTCDPATGCAFVPQHERCADDDPCTEDMCDGLLGCLNPPRIEGSLCGPISCAELALCIAGQCVRGPAPDGFPCEDGDVCTAGDRCRDAACVPGDGDPFGRIGPFEVDLAPDAQPVARVLAVAEAADGGIDLVVLTDPNPYMDDCMADAYDCECCCGAGSGGEVRWLRLTASGVVWEDRLLTLAHDARAVLRDGAVYLAGMTWGDYACQPTAQIGLARFDADGSYQSTWIAPPPGEPAPAFDLAVGDDSVALGVLFSSQAPLCDALPPTCGSQDSLQLIVTGLDLALRGERQLQLTAPPGAVEELALRYHGALLDLAYERVTPTDAQPDACSEAWLRETILRSDALAATPTTEHVLLGDRSRRHALSQVTATYAAGALLASGFHDLAQAQEPLIDPSPEIGNSCAGYEVVRLFSADAAGQLTQVEALRHDQSTRIAQLAAMSALGRLGVLLVDEGGGLQALVPAQGLIPELSLDLSLPVESGRRWMGAAPPVTWSTSDRVLAAGVSIGDPPDSGCGACEEDQPCDCAPLPELAAPLRRVVVAGAGCGMRAP